MNLETMIPKLLECFWGEFLFASQDGESGSQSCIAKGSPNQQRWKPSTWLTIKVRNELSPGSYIHSFFCQIVWLSWIVCPVPYIKPGIESKIISCLLSWRMLRMYHKIFGVKYSIYAYGSQGANKEK
jgi:hypothetical protein